VRETTLQTPTSVKKEGEEVLQAPEQRFPCNPRKSVERQAVPMQPVEVHGGANVQLQPVEDPMPEQADAPKGSCDCGKPTLEQAPSRTCGERSPHKEPVCWQDFRPHKDPCWSSLFQKNCTLWKGPILEQFVKNCSPLEGATLKKFVEDYL